MAGTRRQKALQIPVLIEIAILGGEIDASRWGRTKSKNVEELLDWALSYFSFSAAQRRERHARSGQLVLENDARWAVKQFKEDKLVKHLKDDKWSITDEGLRYLRNYIATPLRKRVSDDEIDRLLIERNCNNEGLLLQALKFIAQGSISLPDCSLEAILLTGDSLAHVFRNAMANLPLHSVGNMVCLGYETLKPLIGRDLAKQYGLVAA